MTDFMAVYLFDKSETNRRKERERKRKEREKKEKET